MSDLTELTNRLDRLGITLVKGGRGNQYVATTSTGDRLELHFKQRNEGSTYRFQFKKGTYSPGDKVFMVCHNTVENKIWVLPRRRWESTATDAGYWTSALLNVEAKDCLFNFQQLLE